MIGVLALQGDWRAHGEALEGAGHQWRPVRVASDLAHTRGVVLPGGESTTLLRLLDPALLAALHTFVERGGPLLATCAGLILAAREVEAPVQRCFGWLDVAVRRNGWGRQLDSFVDRGRVFIRAPRIVDVGPACEVLDTVRGEPALVRQRAVVGATFHPELTRDSTVLRLTFGGARRSAPGSVATSARW